MQDSGGTLRHLAFEAQGEGVPVLLLHGFPFNHALFGPVLPALAEVGRVVAVDLPGFGASSGLGPEFSLADMAKEVLGFARQQALPPRVVVGHSMGGYVAMEMAAQSPDSLVGLVLLNSHPFGDSSQALERRQQGVAMLREGHRREYLENFIQGLLSPVSLRRCPRLVEELQVMVSQVSDEVLVASLLAMAARKDHSHTLTSLRVPVMVMVGEQDALLPMGVAEEIAHLAHDGEFVVVPEAGHLAPLERPIAVADALARFLRKLQR